MRPNFYIPRKRYPKDDFYFGVYLMKDIYMNRRDEIYNWVMEQDRKKVKWAGDGLTFYDSECLVAFTLKFGR